MELKIFRYQLIHVSCLFTMAFKYIKLYNAQRPIYKSKLKLWSFPFSPNLFSILPQTVLLAIKKAHYKKENSTYPSISKRPSFQSHRATIVFRGILKCFHNKNASTMSVCLTSLQTNSKRKQSKLGMKTHNKDLINKTAAL